MKEHLKHPIFGIISRVSEEMGVKSWVIGGYVRDLILERPSKDIDIVVLGSGIELAQKVAESIGRDTQAHYFKNFGTAQITYKNFEIEFVGARKESYRRDSRKPIVEDGSLEDDQNRRDLTINALAISLNKDSFGELLDPFNGIEDIENKVIRTPLDPDITFSDDPLRMLRAIRFSAQLDFMIEEKSLDAIERNSARMSIISAERISDELNKMVISPNPYKAFYLLEKTGLLSIILPEMVALKGVDYKEGKGHKDNFYHTLEVLENVAQTSDSLWLRWAAILHDIGKPQTKRYDPIHGWTFHSHEFVGKKMIPLIFRKLKLPMNEKMRYVQKLVLLHLRPIVLAEDIVSDSAVRRLLYEAGNDVDDLMTLCEADITSKNEAKVRKYLKNFKLVRQKLKEIEAKDKIRNWQPPISGDLIMKTFGLNPCKEIGIIKNDIREGILDGLIPNEFERAYLYMLEKGKDLGLTIKVNRDELTQEDICTPKDKPSKNNE
ncbi:MAG: CCA tRNA nucleotidyltransferase [Hyphomicrobiales bacterium]